MTDQAKKGAPECGLYLVLPDDWMSPDFLKNMRDLFRAINASPYEKNAHVVELRVTSDEFNAEQKEIISAMAQLTKSQGVVFLVGGSLELAKECDADGAMLSDINQIATAREMFGDDAIVGLRVGQSMRVAEKALELGVDIVSFFGVSGGFIDPSIVRWWKVKTDNPCLVEGNITNDDCDFYVRAGADFIDSSNYVWNHPKGVMQGIVNMAFAIQESIEADKRNVH